jgi:hypothetical protein
MRVPNEPTKVTGNARGSAQAHGRDDAQPDGSGSHFPPRSASRWVRRTSTLTAALLAYLLPLNTLRSVTPPRTLHTSPSWCPKVPPMPGEAREVPRSPATHGALNSAGRLPCWARRNRDRSGSPPAASPGVPAKLRTAELLDVLPLDRCSRRSLGAAGRLPGQQSGCHDRNACFREPLLGAARHTCCSSQARRDASPTELLPSTFGSAGLPAVPDSPFECYPRSSRTGLAAHSAPPSTGDAAPIAMSPAAEN